MDLEHRHKTAHVQDQLLPAALLAMPHRLTPSTLSQNVRSSTENEKHGSARPAIWSGGGRLHVVRHGASEARHANLRTMLSIMVATSSEHDR